jgi:nudix-type nucleoside diphosphatase (YffH/AdpP family)
MTDKIAITETKILSDQFYTLKQISYQYKTDKGEIREAKREVYDRGNGVAILLYNKEYKTVILTKQFRLPTFVNANPNGMMIEVCAGSLEEEKPEECIIREVEEETGYKIPKAKKIFESYMSPGAVTEILHFYIAEYTKGMKVNEGGGLDEEHENIEVLELDFDEAYDMISSGEIKDSKTIMLLQYAKIHQLVDKYLTN